MSIYPTDSKYHTATLEHVFACKETVLSAGTVVIAHKSAEGVQTEPLFQALEVPWDVYGT